MSATLAIENGRVIDPQSGRDAVGNVYIADGRIAAVGAAPAGFAARRTIDARGLVVAPGLVDLCARMREPGSEGALRGEMHAALAGGVTGVVCPPDTDPPLDEPGLVRMLRQRSREAAGARLYPLGALTAGLAGQTLAEMHTLAQVGCVAFCQTGALPANLGTLLQALRYARTFDLAVWLRPVDASLAGDGVAGDGALATRLGLPPIPVAAETVALHAIFELQRTTGTRVHVCRLSSAAGVELVRAAKREGLPVSADVSVQHLHLIDRNIGYYDTNCRLDPPLRGRARPRRDPRRTGRRHDRRRLLRPRAGGARGQVAALRRGAGRRQRARDPAAADARLGAGRRHRPAGGPGRRHRRARPHPGRGHRHPGARPQGRSRHLRPQGRLDRAAGRFPEQRAQLAVCRTAHDGAGALDAGRRRGPFRARGVNSADVHPPTAPHPRPLSRYAGEGGNSPSPCRRGPG